MLKKPVIDTQIRPAHIRGQVFPFSNLELNFWGMARPLRLEFDGALYHVTSRGDGREDIYLSDSDRRGFLDVLAGVRERFNWTVHAFCLMSNHYHLLIDEDTFDIHEAYSFGMSPRDKKQIRKIIFEHFEYIAEQWREFQERR